MVGVENNGHIELKLLIIKDNSIVWFSCDKYELKKGMIIIFEAR